MLIYAAPAVLRRFYPDFAQKGAISFFIAKRLFSFAAKEILCFIQ